MPRKFLIDKLGRQRSLGGNGEDTVCFFLLRLLHGIIGRLGKIGKRSPQTQGLTSTVRCVILCGWSPPACCRPELVMSWAMSAPLDVPARRLVFRAQRDRLLLGKRRCDLIRSLNTTVAYYTVAGIGAGSDSTWPATDAGNATRTRPECADTFRGTCSTSRHRRRRISATRRRWPDPGPA